jgi:Zn-dependent protease/CBS domain-containing protein
MLTGQRWKVATVRGIPLYVSTSWVWIAGLYVWSVYANLSGLGPVVVSSFEAIVLAVLAAVLFFGSILIHETAHAVMARRLDLPVRSVTLVFWGGATETRANARGPLGEFLVAFVGPASTLVIAGLFRAIALATSGVASHLIGYLAWLSLVLAILNALPGFPLDGGRMLLAIVWGITKNRRTALRVAGWSGVMVGVAFGAAAVWAISNDDLGLGLFFGYLAAILISTGRGMDQRIAFRDQLLKGRVAEAMRPPPPAVPVDMSLADALDHSLRGSKGQAFPLVDEGRVIGTISMQSARRVGARNPMRPARDAMIPLNQTPVLDPDETLDEAFEWLGGRDGLVLKDGALVGAIGPHDVEQWYRRVIEGQSSPTGFAQLPPRPDL